MNDAPQRYHLFVSYARTPDAAIARELERFLESFHQMLGPRPTAPLVPLAVCLDGSDFSMPPPDERASATREVFDVVAAHLVQARELLVCCSSGAARSQWIDKELRWFIARFGAARVRIAITEGDRPWADPASVFPPAALEHRLDKTIFYDLRGHDPRSRGWTQVHDVQRELVRLAADLHGLPAGEIYPTWLEAELVRARERSVALVSSARYETFNGDPGRALLIAHEAHALHPGADTDRALRHAYRAALLHHRNRREIAMITGEGPAYLAGRWKQGALFVQHSPDGRFHLLVTERGRDGPNPPGDVYLVNNESLRPVKLEPPQRGGGRVEAVAFDSASREVLVTRYFDLHVYALDGRLTRTFTFSYWTKSPVHLVAGRLAGRFVIGGDTRGRNWLVDPARAGEGMQPLPGGVLTMVEIAPDGRHALIVLDNGGASLLELDADDRAQLRPLAARDVLHARFVPGDGGPIVLGQRDGRVRIVDAAGIEQLASVALGAPVDWVSISADRLLAVAEDERLHVLDRASGERLQTLHFPDAIGADDVRGIPLTAHEVLPQTAEALGPALPFPPPALGVVDVQRAGGHEWLFTLDYSRNEYWPDKMAWRVEGAEVVPRVKGAAGVTERGPLLHFHEGPTAWLRSGDELTWFPPGAPGADAVCIESGRCFVGTAKGLFVAEPGGPWLRHGPEELWVRRIEAVAGRLWMTTQDHGLCVFEPGRLVPVGPAFAKVNGMREAAGSAWLLAGTAWRIDGYRHHAPAGRDTPVRDVIDIDGTAWLVGPDRLHRVEGDTVRTTAALPHAIGRVHRIGGSIVVTTNEEGFFPGPRGAYRIDLATLAVSPIETPRPPTLVLAGGSAWLHWVVPAPGTGMLMSPVPPAELADQPGAVGSLARLTEAGCVPVNVDGASVRDVIALRGGVWLASDQGAWRLDGTTARRVGNLREPIRRVCETDASLWLLGDGAAWRLDAGDTWARYAIAEGEPAAVARIAGVHWLLTSAGTFAHGPVYRLGARLARRVSPRGLGVSKIVECQGRLWMLTWREGRPAGMLAQAVRQSGTKRVR